MRCINKYSISIKAFLSAFLLFAAASALSGCSKREVRMPFRMDSSETAFSFETSNENNTALPFATDLAVPQGDLMPGDEIGEGDGSYGSAILVDSANANMMYSKNALASLYPASMTKVMTAIVAVKNASPDQVFTADESCVFTEGDVQKVGLKSGDTMTMDQALHLLLIYSANDVAQLIAVNIAGSTEAFSDMMNSEAAALGATNTHFVNPHGLQDENHYTTAYDMYLMFNEAVKYEEIVQVISSPNYSTVYKHSDGSEASFSCDNTNRFLKGSAIAPGNINVIGGKTGTTLAAGGCLVMLSRDSGGNNYISCVMKGKTIDVTYGKTSSMLSLIK
ncbi:MAG: D-alanyl-D-alanine carboxypeptidase [Lachnospiraceae bacterium]|nr:D-alanyl-D-alanine carboxypeptidase [Lachnospiraceae bacterium]